MAKVLHGAASTDQLVVTADKTQAYGLKGDDTLISDNKKDVLLVGGSGDDSLVMTGGDGTLNGGAGKDVFEFTYSADKKVSAVIEDFNPSEDKIVVNNDGDSKPQITTVTSSDDVVLSDSGGNFNVTLKGVRENDYFDGEAREEIWEVLERTNQVREDENLPALTLSEGLMAGASVRAEEIKIFGQEGVLPERAHTRPDGTDYRTVLNGKYVVDGENLDGGAESPEKVLEDWINSPKHYENILDTRFSKLGVGYNVAEDETPADDDNGYIDWNLNRDAAHKYYWVQLFADSLKSAETVSAESLLTADIETATVKKFITDNSNDDYGVTIAGSGGNDSITNTGAVVSISGDAGDDTINNSGANVTINGGLGDDSINLQSDYALIEYAAGDGSDTISGLNSTDTVSISGGEYYTQNRGSNIIVAVGNDSITLLDAVNSGVKIVGERSALYIGTEEDDTLENSVSNATIQTFEGNDTINNSGSSVTIDSGAGDDFISNKGENVLFLHESGSDTIQGFNSTSSLKVASGSYSSVASGKDLILIKDGATEFIRLSDGAGLSAVNIFDTNDKPLEVKDAKNVVLDNDNNTYINVVDNATIAARGGDDTISNSGSRVSISGGDGNDSVVSEGARVTILGGNGDDTISLSDDAKNNLIQYTAGNDTIFGFSDSDTLDLGNYAWETVKSEQDILVNILENSAIVGTVTLKDCSSVSEDSIIPRRVAPSVPGINISNYTSSTLITGTAGNDSIFNSGDSVTIDGGAGNDSIRNGSNIYSNGENVSIDGGAGDDSITNGSSQVTINGGTGNDSLYNYGTSVVIESGSGDDSIWNGSDSVTIDGGTDDDYIFNYEASNLSIMSGLGDDSINNYGGSNVTIDAGAGNDTIYNTGNGVTIDGSAGNDSIDNHSSEVIIIGGEDDDTIYNSGENVTIDGGAGDDSIYNGSSQVTINGDIGNDTIHNYGASVTIESRADDDTIWNYSDSVTIDGGAGDDSIENTAENVSINSGDGDDLISNTGNNVSILGGKNDDKIRLSSYRSQNSFVQYTLGDGNDTVWGANGDDTLRIFASRSQVSSVTSGQDVTIKVGEGEILLVDAKDKLPNIIIGESNTDGGTDKGGDPKGDNPSSNDSKGNDKGDKGKNNDTSEGLSTNVDNNPNAVEGARSAIGSDGSGNSGDRGGNDIGEQNPSATPTPNMSELHSYLDNAAALEVETQAPPEKLSLSFPTNWNFPSPNEIKLPSLILDGTPGNDELHAGGEGYQLWGHEGDDTLIGGEGYDVFFGGMNQGSDTFLNVSASDVVYLSDVTFNDLSRISKDGDTVTFAFKNGNSVTIQSTDTVSGAVVLNDLTLHFTHQKA